MKWLLPLLVLYCFSVKSQLNHVNKHDLKMDSISMVKFSVKVLLDGKKSSWGYRPSPKVKITFKTRLNLNLSDSATIQQDIQYIEETSVITLMKYDIRCKVYLNKQFSLVGRGLFIDEHKFGANTYSLGLMGKF